MDEIPAIYMAESLEQVRALADELRWRTEVGPNSAELPARLRLADTFVPRSRSWRTKSLQTGLSLVRDAARVLWAGK